MRKESGYRSQRERERQGAEGVSPEQDVRGSEARPREACGWSRGGCISGQLIFGAVIVIVGLSLLLDNLGIIESSRDVLRFWPVALIAAGFGDLIAARGRGRAVRGTLLTAFGGLFLLNNLGVVDFNVFELWPLFLILFGVQMLMRSVSRPGSAEEAGAVDNAEFDDFAFLGGVKRANTSAAFRGGSATAFMGGVELDLRKARMEGQRAVINVFAMMGGISLRIPEDWAVESKIVALLGGVDDKTRPPSQPVGTLVLQGTVVMGGVEIKD
jgi:predicted membrane protein